MNRDRRLELNLLSTLAFGVKSRWKTILERGTIIEGRWSALTEQQIEDTMNHIIETRRQANERVHQQKGTESTTPGIDGKDE